MTEPSKAVFLSYASQDSEVALRICEALRAGGVEVWLDQEGGLVGGDAWDRKIREQIASCALFIPIVSASTQARHEGYFRLEWKLAVARYLSIAAAFAALPVKRGPKSSQSYSRKACGVGDNDSAADAAVAGTRKNANRTARLRRGAGCEASRGAEPLMDFANGRNFGNLASAHRLRFKVGSLLIAG